MAVALAKPKRWIWLAATLLLSGCHWGLLDSPSPVQESHAVRFNRARNGAALSSGKANKSNSVPPRKLAFEMTGFAARPTNEQARDRSAVRQAAIIDGLGRALIEARRARGQSTNDFTTRIGPNLTVTHRSMWRGQEIHVVLVHRGEEIRFEVVNGVLNTPPQDFQVIQKIFEQTNGEFSLLGVENSIQQNCCMARVGGYLPVAPQSRLAGSAEEPAEIP